MVFQIYQELKKYYPLTIKCKHWRTWELWIKKNKTPEEIFEVAVGTILVQNTNWVNVNKAMVNLQSSNVNSFESLFFTNLNTLENLIKPAGFYKQKSHYLKSLSELLINFDGSIKTSVPSRKSLLKIHGVGKETADSILVYCYSQPSPIIGTYTRRFLTRLLGDVSYIKKKYEIIQDEIKEQLGISSEVLGTFHALVVCHCQNYCSKKSPQCGECFLKIQCYYGTKEQNYANIIRIQELIENPQGKK